MWRNILQTYTIRNIFRSEYKRKIISDQKVECQNKMNREPIERISNREFHNVSKEEKKEKAYRISA